MDTTQKSHGGWLTVFVIGLVLAVGVGIGATLLARLLAREAVMSDTRMTHEGEYASAEHFTEVGDETHEGIRTLIAASKYKCSLAEPCSYCFSDPEHQGRELVCDCLVDIMNGKHPCGECIGGILEGHGNPLIAEYFATAIAEKVGDSHLPTLKQIVAEKYEIPTTAQR